MQIRLWQFFILFLSLLPALVSAESIIRDERAVIRFDPPLEKAAAEVLSSYRGLINELRSDIGLAPEIRIEIHLVTEAASFRKRSGSDLISAIALPSKNLIVMDYSKMAAHPFSLMTTLKHELCHLELHHIAGDGGTLPRWFDEGICQWVTGGFSEIISDRKPSVLGSASFAKRLLPLEALSVSFPADSEGMTLAYAQSRSIIEFMEKKYGKEGLRSIIAFLGSGDELDVAIQKATGEKLSDIETGWRRSLEPARLWPHFLRDYFYEALFLFAALLCVCGFFRILRKKREYRDEPDEEDPETPETPESDSE